MGVSGREDLKRKPLPDVMWIAREMFVKENSDDA